MERDRAKLNVWNLVALAGLACCWESPAAMAQAEEEEAGEVEAAWESGPATSDDEIEISVFDEPLDLAVLVEFVADALGIDITVQGELTGQVSFVSPRTIRRADLLPLLERLLDQHNFALMYDPVLDRYLIRPTAAVSGGGAGGEFSTTRIIPTPNIRPSSLTETLTAYGTAVGGVGQISYLDDIGVVVVTGPPIRARETEAYIQSLVEQAKRIEYTRINLTHLSATTARERAIALATGNSSNTAFNFPGRGNNDNNANALRAGASFDNLADRLSAERHSNSLIFRGLPEEAERVRSLIELIDQPTNLTPREFFAGSLAAQVARIASGLGLGEVVEIDEDDEQTQANRAFQRVNPNNQFGTDTTEMAGGSLMVVDAKRGMIIHYGTPEQQEQLESLVLELKADGERIVIREYKLENATAEVIADLLQALVDGGNDQSDGTLLPGISRPNQANRAQPSSVGGGDGSFTAQAEDVYVGYFEPQNMVLVKAPAEVQSQFEELIERLDQRSPQVFLDVQIVSVTNTDDFRFAVESQIIAGQYGLQTNY
ncbi:MAG: hypothetical protein KDB18_12980, partial [Salinibacterium sp.]|nr:hypothetical protein [Salinibacterium sp.]